LLSDKFRSEFINNSYISALKFGKIVCSSCDSDSGENQHCIFLTEKDGSYEIVEFKIGRESFAVSLGSNSIQSCVSIIDLFVSCEKNELVKKNLKSFGVLVSNVGVSAMNRLSP
jgi:hypothetical protein